MHEVKPRQRYDTLLPLLDAVTQVQRELEKKRLNKYDTLFLPETVTHVRRELRCVKQQESNKKYYLKNREKELARTREWRQKNSETTKIRDRQYYLKHRGRILTKYREWRQENLETARLHSRERSKKCYYKKIQTKSDKICTTFFLFCRRLACKLPE